MCYMVHFRDINMLYGSYLGHQCATWFILGHKFATLFIFWTSMYYMGMVHISDINMLHGSYLGHLCALHG